MKTIFRLYNQAVLVSQLRCTPTGDPQFPGCANVKVVYKDASDVFKVKSFPFDQPQKVIVAQLLRTL